MKTGNKNRMIALTILAALLLTSLASGQAANIYTDKDTYSTGQTVNIYLEGYTNNDRVFIKKTDKYFKYQGRLEPVLEFTPDSQGNYSIEIRNVQNDVKDSAKFTVVPQNIFASITLDKNTYTLGEKVSFSVESGNDTTMRIQGAGEIYRFMGDINGRHNFIPTKTGTYNINIISDGRVLETETFQVNEETSIDTNTNTQITNITPEKTSKKEGIQVELESAKKNYELREAPGFVLRFWNSSKQGTWKNTMPRNEVIKQAVSERRGDKWSANGKVIKVKMYDSVGREQEVKKTIRKLEDGFFHIELEKPRQFRAGRYEMKVWLEKDNETYVQTQDFTWGVLAINTHKSIYKPQEEAFIGMAVLDDQGNMVCDAEVNLTITNPQGEEELLSTNNGRINVSEECSYLGVTNLPDYYANYTVQGSGTYEMNLTTRTYNGVRTMMENFTVQEQVSFDVARQGPTRIYPKVPYMMNFTITPSNDFNGMIREYVPRSFKITPQDGMSTTVQGNTKVLRWNVDLSQDEKYQLSYEFDAPDVSPQFYVLGELEIGTWSEARQWQIASDAVIDPVGIQTCSAEDEAAQGSFGGTCDGSYPSACSATGDLLSCNDGNSEQHTTRGGNFAGVLTTSYNDTVTDCAEVTKVEVCYEWWRDYNRQTDNCVIAVDNDNDGTWQNVTNACPSTGSEPGVTCSDVTSLETDWACGNFFGSTGTRSEIMSEASKIPSQGGPGTIIWDVLHYRVTYRTPIPPNVTLQHPANDSTVETSTIDFNFTVTDELDDPIPNCNLYTNTSGTWQEDKTITNVLNNTETNITLSGINDGNYKYNVQCNDSDASTAFAENNYTFRVNANSPSITNLNLNESVINQSETVGFNVTITDEYGVSSALITLLYPNGTSTNMTLTNTSTLWSTTITDTTQLGIYNVTLIWANDTLGKIATNNSPGLFFEVTASPPATFNLLTPSNGTESSNLIPNLTWEQTSESDFANYTILLDKDSSFGSPDFTYYNFQIDNTSRVVDFALDSNSVYYWRVIAYDTFGNNRSSNQNFTYITDTLAPFVTLNTPLNDSFVKSSVTFNYTPSDTNTLDACTLWGNFTGTWQANETEPNPIDGQANFLSTNINNDGVYVWNVNCNDTASNAGFAESNYTIKVDTTGPQVNLVSPANNTLENETNNILFIANSTDFMASTDSCELVINNVSEQTDTSITDGVNFNFTEFVSNGQYYWNVNCTDVNENEASSVKYNLTVNNVDNNAPLITLNEPLPAEFLSTNNVTFNYTPEDATGIENCSIYLDNTLNKTDSQIENFVPNTFNISLISDGYHEWNVTCYDNSTENNLGKSSTRNFTIDTIQPTEFNLSSPPNGTEPEKVIKRNWTVLNWTQTSDANFNNYTITLDNDSDMSSPEYEFNTFQVTNTSINVTLDDNVYYWKVTAYDDANNARETETWTFRLHEGGPNFTATGEIPPSPVNYSPTRTYVFNATLEEFAVDTIWLEHNFTGTFVNDTNVTFFTPDNHTYYVNFTITTLQAGTYMYQWYANDTENQIGNTSEFTYQVNKAQSDVNLTINDTDGNFTINEDSTSNLTSTLQTPTNGNVELYLDGSLIESGPSPLTNITLFSEPGTFNVTTIYQGNENYTISRDTHFVLVNDITNPTVNLVSPENDSFVGTNDVTFRYNVSDNANIVNCSLYIDGTFQQNDSTITQDTEQTFSENLADGNYTWQVQCYDDSDNLGLSPTYNFSVLNTDSIDVNVSTDKSAYERGDTANITTITKDVFGNSLQTNVTLDVIRGNTSLSWWNTNWKNRKPVFINETQGIDWTNALIEVNVTGLNNQISSCSDELRLIRNNTNSTQEVPIKVRDGDSSNWCLIVFYENVSASAVNHDNLYVYYNNSAATNPNYNLDTTDYMLLNAQQAGGNGTTPSNIIGKNDTTFSNISITGGGGQEETSHGRDFIENTTHDPLEVRVRYRFEVPSIGTGNWELRHSVDNGGSYTTSFSGASTESKQTSAWDDITGAYSSLTWTNLNNTRLQGRVFKTGGSSTVTMLLYWVEMNVTVDLDPDLTQTSVGSEEVHIERAVNTTGENGEWMYPFDTSGQQFANYSAVGMATKENFSDTTSSSLFEIIPDTTNPNVTLLKPEDFAEKGVGDTDFIYEPSDINLDACTLYVGQDGTLNPNTTDNNPTSDQNNTFTNIPFKLGVYQWNVWCNDTAGNSDFASTNFTLNITGPDLTITKNNITFGNESRIEGENTTIFANVSNIGLTDANQSFTIQFYKGDPDAGGTQINGDKVVPRLNASDWTVVNTSYTQDAGVNEIYVLVDSNNVINETDETNNKASRNLTVPIYQHMYGNITTDIILSDSENKSLIKYENYTQNLGHIFVADTDSNFNFADLHAITRNTNGNPTSDDFTNIDNNLNTSNTNDSVKIVWGDGTDTPIRTENFSLLFGDINNVPVVNSTNTSSFISGILWDTNDDASANLQYDETDDEDLVFITRINVSKQGRYGTYDYEIKVPAPVKEYKGSNDRLAIYYELK